MSFKHIVWHLKAIYTYNQVKIDKSMAKSLRRLCFIKGRLFVEVEVYLATKCLVEV